MFLNYKTQILGSSILVPHSGAVFETGQTISSCRVRFLQTAPVSAGFEGSIDAWCCLLPINQCGCGSLQKMVKMADKKPNTYTNISCFFISFLALIFENLARTKHWVIISASDCKQPGLFNMIFEASVSQKPEETQDGMLMSRVAVSAALEVRTQPGFLVTPIRFQCFPLPTFKSVILTGWHSAAIYNDKETVFNVDLSSLVDTRCTESGQYLRRSGWLHQCTLTVASLLGVVSRFKPEEEVLHLAHTCLYISVCHRKWTPQRDADLTAARCVTKHSRQRTSWRIIRVSTPERDRTSVTSVRKLSLSRARWNSTGAVTLERNPTAVNTAGRASLIHFHADNTNTSTRVTNLSSVSSAPKPSSHSRIWRDIGASTRERNCTAVSCADAVSIITPRTPSTSGSTAERDPTGVGSAIKPSRHPPTTLSTSASTRGRDRSAVSSVGRLSATSPLACCTSASTPVRNRTGVSTAAKASSRRRTWRDTCGLTPGRSRTGATSVRNTSPSPVSWRDTAASDVWAQCWRLLDSKEGHVSPTQFTI